VRKIEDFFLLLWVNGSGAMENSLCGNNEPI
jgi:hypothetical protein